MTAATRAAALRAASTASVAAGEWWEDHTTLAELWRWLEERGEQPSDPAYYLEKPYKWQVEYDQMRKAQAALERRNTEFDDAHAAMGDAPDGWAA